eukprot:scaffold236557_cov28-Tisochrysis_lutea.AAC.3
MAQRRMNEAALEQHDVELPGGAAADAVRASANDGACGCDTSMKSISGEATRDGTGARQSGVCVDSPADAAPMVCVEMETV